MIFNWNFELNMKKLGDGGDFLVDCDQLIGDVGDLLGDGGDLLSDGGVVTSLVMVATSFVIVATTMSSRRFVKAQRRQQSENLKKWQMMEVISWQG